MELPQKKLVLVHGFMGSALNWGPILTRLKKSPLMDSWEFITPDLLGHGGRRGPDSISYTKLTLKLMTEDLEKQLSTFIGPSDSCVVLGHSFGIRPLLKLCDSTWGNRIAHFIVEDATPEISQENYQRLVSILEKVPVPFSSREEAKQQIYSLFSHDVRLAAFLFSNIRSMTNPENGLASQDWRFDKYGLLDVLKESSEAPLWKEWSTISQPITLISGENSDHLTSDRIEQALKLRGELPIQHLQIAQSGHWIHSDQPDVFADTIIKLVNLSKDSD